MDPFTEEHVSQCLHEISILHALSLVAKQAHFPPWCDSGLLCDNWACNPFLAQSYRGLIRGKMAPIRSGSIAAHHARVTIEFFLHGGLEKCFPLLLSFLLKDSPTGPLGLSCFETSYSKFLNCVSFQTESPR